MCKTCKLKSLAKRRGAKEERFPIERQTEKETRIRSGADADFLDSSPDRRYIFHLPD